MFAEVDCLRPESFLGAWVGAFAEGWAKLWLALAPDLVIFCHEFGTGDGV